MPPPALSAKRPAAAGPEPIGPSELPAGIKGRARDVICDQFGRLHDLMARPPFAALALSSGALSDILLVHFSKMKGAKA